MNWKKEIELLRKQQHGDKYGENICDNLDETMTLISKQGHSGTSFSFFARYLIRLLQEKPLFPITADELDWGTDIDPNQNNRVTSIFRQEDGTISDINRVLFSDQFDNTWYNPVCTEIINKMFPITLPYMPSEKPYIVYGESLLLDADGNDITTEDKGSFNFKKLHYVITPEGTKVDLNTEIDFRGAEK